MKKKFRQILLSIASGALAGLAAAAFLWLLQIATDSREASPSLIFGLPFAGFLIGWAYHRYGREISSGNNLILDEIHEPKKVVPLRMAPFIFIGTVITHLFGGSAGREGTAVQMGASLADQLSKVFRVDASERKILLMTGAGAGFGAAIGAPWAGAIFGMEVLRLGRLKPVAVLENVIASFVGYAVTLFLRAPHSRFPEIAGLDYDAQSFLFVALAGVAFGLSAMIFIRLTHAIEKILSRRVNYAPLKPFIGGLFVVAGFAVLGTRRFEGLGISVVHDALTSIVSFGDPVLKGLFTAITIGSGFKGGEFVPLVFMGTTLGSALSSIFPVSTEILAAAGFAAVFGSAASTPIACTVMAIEIFGMEIGPYAALACFVAYLFSGQVSLYRSQRIEEAKHERLFFRSRRPRDIQRS